MNPMPPNTWVATRAAVIAVSVLYSLAIAAACLNGLPRSFKRAAPYTRLRLFSTATARSASWNDNPWKRPIGPPNAWRCLA